MAWQKNGTPNTISSPADVMTISDMSALKFNQFLIHSLNSGEIGQDITFNNDTNPFYSNRRSNNGSVDSTNVNETNMSRNGNYTADEFQLVNTVSITGEAKLVIRHFVTNLTLGPGTAPTRVEAYSKFIPSPDAEITRIDVTNPVAGDYITDSNLSALGTN